MKIHSLLLGTAFMASALSVAAQDNTITVQTKKIGSRDSADHVWYLL